MALTRTEINRRYEAKHKKERKEKILVWGTSIPRTFGNEINDFLKEHNFTKVDLINAGYQFLVDKVNKENHQ